MRQKRRAIALLLLPALVFTGGCNDDSSTPTSASTAPSQSSGSSSGTTASNGVDKLSPTEILQRAKAASVGARAVRIRGTATDKGETFTLDLRIMGKKAAKGFIGLQGKRVDIIRLGSVVYFKGDKAFWTSAGGKDAATMLTGKYLKTTAKNKDFADITSFTVMSKIFDELLKPEGAPRKAGQETVDGRQAIALADGSGGKLYVATEGEPQVLRLSQGKDQIDFLDYGKIVPVKAPPADIVIDADKLG